MVKQRYCCLVQLPEDKEVDYETEDIRKQSLEKYYMNKDFCILREQILSKLSINIALL